MGRLNRNGVVVEVAGLKFCKQENILGLLPKDVIAFPVDCVVFEHLLIHTFDTGIPTTTYVPIVVGDQVCIFDFKLKKFGGGTVLATAKLVGAGKGRSRG